LGTQIRKVWHPKYIEGKQICEITEISKFQSALKRKTMSENIQSIVVKVLDSKMT
jgi:hypothetical protein